MVVFGQLGNFRKERLEFEVVDWESHYHAILGRPVFAKFMAIPHYAYLKLKMSGNNGTTLTVHGSFLDPTTAIRNSTASLRSSEERTSSHLPTKSTPAPPPSRPRLLLSW